MLERARASESCKFSEENRAEPTGDREQQRKAIALASAIVVTFGFLVSLDRLTSDQSQWSLPKATYIETRLIDRTIPAEPIAPAKLAPASPAIPPFARAQTRRSIEVPAAGPIVLPQQRPLDLFTRDGAVRLPSDLQSPSQDHDDRRILSHRDLVPVEPEHFAWAKPANESLGGALMRKIYNHKWELPWGTIVSCVQGVPTGETPFVIECRPGKPGATSDELRAMRVDPPPDKARKAHASASLARREHGTPKASLASLRD